MRTMLVGVAALLGASVVGAQQELPWYRTMVPEITSERWEQPPPPLPEPGAITRADYLEYIQRTWAVQRDYYRERAGRADVKGQYVFARREAFLYHATGDEEHARLAMEFIRGDLAYWSEGGGGAERGTGFNVLLPALQAWRMIRESPSLTEDDAATALEWFLTIERKAERFEFGAMNRSAGWAVARDILARWYPDLPGNAERLEYAQTVWDEWYPFRDSAENAEGYNGLWLSYIAEWIEARGEEELWADPEFRALAYRFLDQVTPVGVMASYGDVPGFNSHVGGWIEMMEVFGAHYRDGRFRWAAHRLFEWTVAREEAMSQWGNINFSLADDLISTWLVADDSIAPVLPDTSSTVTQRRDAALVSPEERAATNRHDRLFEGMVPNKLILRDGWDAGASFAMVELCRPLGHGHSDAGGISAYVSQGSVLLSDTPYLVKDHRWHNCMTCEPWPPPEGRWRWRANEFGAMQTSVQQFESAPNAAYAHLRITDFMQQPVTVDRRIFFLGDAGLWVEDSVEATAPHPARFGPNWQTVAIYGERGPNWVNTYQPTIPVAFIWELQYMMQWPNRPWDLLVWFEPQGDAELALEDVTHDDTRMIVDQPLMNNLKWRIAQRAIGELQPGAPRRFTSVLLPHAPTPDASALADGIETVRLGGLSAVRVPTEDGRTIWAARNEGGESAQFGPIETDARLALVTLREGAEPRYWLVDATRLTIAGAEVFTAAEPTTVCEE